ncbi:MAG: hypothetical protein ACRDIE_22090, partial [Chloroflexota bacterium]
QGMSRRGLFEKCLPVQGGQTRADAGENGKLGGARKQRPNIPRFIGGARARDAIANLVLVAVARWEEVGRAKGWALGRRVVTEAQVAEAASFRPMWRRLPALTPQPPRRMSPAAP